MIAHRHKKGFSLIELLTYGAILGMTMVVVVTAVAGIGRAYGRVKANQALARSAANVFERVTRDVRFAATVDTTQSVLGSPLGSLFLTMPGTPGAAVSYSVVNGAIRLTEAGVVTGDLTTEGVHVSQFAVTRVINGVSEAVKIDMTLEKRHAQATSTATFHTAAVLRGSYAP